LITDNRSPHLRRPAVIGGAGAAVGLLVGILVGRASVPAHDDSATVVQAEGKLAARPETAEDTVEDPTPVTGDYRRQVGRSLPNGATGFSVAQISKRAVAALGNGRATLPFEMTPADESYGFAAIAGVEGEKSAKLQVELDGKPLGEVTPTEGWGIYSIPIPAGSLSAGVHELGFIKDPTSSGTLGLESIAITPVTPEADIAMDKRAVGAMIEGFSNPGHDSVWSNGPRSAVGIVLAHVQGAYRLKVRGAAIPKLAPMVVAATVNGKSLGSARFEKTAGTAEWQIPEKALQSGANRIEFSYPNTVKPSEANPKSKDNRRLAVRFYQITLQPD
jgi:hypothetical protein